MAWPHILGTVDGAACCLYCGGGPTGHGPCSTTPYPGFPVIAWDDASARRSTWGRWLRRILLGWLALLAGCGGRVDAAHPIARLDVVPYAGADCVRVDHEVLFDAGRSVGFEHLAWELDVAPPYETSAGRFEVFFVPKFEGDAAVRLYAIGADGRVDVAEALFHVWPSDSDCGSAP